MKKLDSRETEKLLAIKLFEKKQQDAALRIQAWWKKRKLIAWFSLIK